MSISFSEFERLLGADPANQDPAFLEARQSSTEFVEAARAADRLEQQLRAALALPVPADLVIDLHKLAASKPSRLPHWRVWAMAASVLLVVTIAGLNWRAVAPGAEWESVESYVVDHYGADGAMLLERATREQAGDANEILAPFSVSLTPEMVRQVGLVKYCPTPDGRGVHLVLNTEQGAVTIMFMPKTHVIDGQVMAFDDMQALLVSLIHGSAAIVGTRAQQLSGLHSAVKESFVFANVDA